MQPHESQIIPPKDKGGTQDMQAALDTVVRAVLATFDELHRRFNPKNIRAQDILVFRAGHDIAAHFNGQTKKFAFNGNATVVLRNVGDENVIVEMAIIPHGLAGELWAQEILARAA